MQKSVIHVLGYDIFRINYFIILQSIRLIVTERCPILSRNTALSTSLENGSVLYSEKICHILLYRLIRGNNRYMKKG